MAQGALNIKISSMLNCLYDQLGPLLTGSLTNNITVYADGPLNSVRDVGSSDMDWLFKFNQFMYGKSTSTQSQGPLWSLQPWRVWSEAVGRDASLRSLSQTSALSLHIATIWHLLMNNDIDGINVDIHMRTDSHLYLTDATGHTHTTGCPSSVAVPHKGFCHLPGHDLLSSLLP